MKKYTIPSFGVLTAFLFFSLSLFSQDTYIRNESVDIKKYVFNLQLNDTTNSIEGEAEIHVDFENEPIPFNLDLIEFTGNYGMRISDVSEAEKSIDYVFENNKIKIQPTKYSPLSQVYKVKYHGIPERGLVIDTTKFGKRSFFGDNWPNLARHWLPSVDYPYDKAAIEFRITAPRPL
ncbi:hypothetical protein NYZ99_17365 [Maribacter litopenaei]|uniref:Uncharacterized protein n=1 Tax=Maribacter litopenaei TaxID=2976127 RepID=A0ABY5Y8D3_9FLAO|nr:hypothetical protein [Maribacter litopenaei]UWX54617.1 hypothetical protein NYZ99_17365 [Maribacter litopenaei]